MLLAWYGLHKELSEKPWYIAALVSWAIALFEYLIQVLGQCDGRLDSDMINFG